MDAHLVWTKRFILREERDTVPGEVFIVFNDNANIVIVIRNPIPIF